MPEDRFHGLYEVAQIEKCLQAINALQCNFENTLYSPGVWLLFVFCSIYVLISIFHLELLEDG